MKYAQNNPDTLDKLIVADISPRAYEVHHQKILAGLLAVDLVNIAKRSQANEILEKYIPELGVRQFLLKTSIGQKKGD